MTGSIDIAAAQVTNPAINAKLITPADTDLADGLYTRGIYVGVTGDLAVRMVGDLGDEDVVFTAVPAGSIIPIVVRQIRLTGTTATNIVILF